MRTVPFGEFVEKKTEKLLDAQYFITHEIQRQGSARVDAMSWGQSPWDSATSIHRLTVIRDGEKAIFT